MTATLNLRHLYGWSAGYEVELAAFAAVHGLIVPRHQPWQCLRRLTKPTHLCSHNQDDDGMDRPWLDHLVWLRRPADGTWALLCQPYGNAHPGLAAWCFERGLTATHIGPAPYGNGTAGIVITGRPGAGR